MFAVVTGTTISCSLCRQYRPVLTLSFLDVYECSIPRCLRVQDVKPFSLQCLLAQPFPAAWASSTGHYLSIYEYSMWHYYVISGHCCNYFLHPWQAALVSTYLSFLDVYGYRMSRHYVFSGHRYNYFLQP